MSARSTAVAVAIANLYLLSLTGPLVSPQHQLLFHLPGSATALFLPVLLDLLLLTVAIAALLLWTQTHPRAQLLLYTLLLLPLPWTLVQTLAGFTGHPPLPALRWLTALPAVLTLAYIIVRPAQSLRWFQRVHHSLETVLSLVALSGLVIFAQLLSFGWKTRRLNQPFVSQVKAQPALANSPAPRVVWLILDELSYRQVYGHRARGLALPNFDRLAAQATLFLQAEATAAYTRIAVPSLLTGQTLRATLPSADGQQLLLRARGERRWEPLRPANTVFGDAVAAGLPTGIAGWYEPYCRLLPTVLNRCVWTYSDDLPGGLSTHATLLANTLQVPKSALLQTLHVLHLGPGVPSADARDVQRHGADYRALFAAGDELLSRQRTGVLLLHMPIPHPWGFYDRRTHTFPGHRTSYLDNLALADMYLGHLCALLEAQGSWESTDVIVMGDHGWRTDNVWRQSGHWTPDEQQASQGAASPDNPVLLIKLHGQGAAAIIPARFDAVRTRALIDALLHRQINTPEQIKRWVTGTSAQD